MFEKKSEKADATKKQEITQIDFCLNFLLFRFFECFAL